MASTSPYGCAVLVALMSSLMPVSAAQGQDLVQQYRPDSEGYPCSARNKRTVTQEDQGFAIRPAGEVRPAEPQRQPRSHGETLIAVGATMKLDAALLHDRVSSLKEAVNAPRR